MNAPDFAFATLQRLRLRMERLFAVCDLPLDVAGAPRRWALAMPADPDAPLDQLAAQLLAIRGVLPGQRTESGELPEDTDNAATAARRTAMSGGLLP